MAEPKTKQHDGSVKDFIHSFADTEQKQKDSFELIKLFQEWTGFEPKMWGPSIIGFGVYHYKSERSKQEGDWPLVGFSPRKAAISLYVKAPQGSVPEQENLLKELGKYKMGKGCIYVKKLSDINTSVLQKMVETSVEFLKKNYLIK
ncbi:DUF1801 domain-containing protein [Fluviicola sp.]|jgi:hypothetical protein|uniref:DUF1801 domain-containing protein n=1 Tax=Fluviicola sp. TaxID=1917219 RepID=UPI002838A472|nr:DUF1801 domain-containing protein [Fluviicola sp.]MDR0802450.1 DUF1801 domain-containing protein [Fluviicola sp.]